MKCILPAIALAVLFSFAPMKIRVNEYQYTFSDHTIFNGKDSLFCKYELDFPVFKGCKKLRNALNLYVSRNILNRPLNTALPEKQLGDSIRKDWLGFHSEWQMLLKQNPEFPLNYVKKTEIKQAYETGNYVSVYTKTYYYTGGAHGLDWLEYAVFNSKSGNRILNWQELFKDTTSIMQYAEEKLKKEKYIMFGYSLADGGWFWGKSFYLNNNFAVNPNGILFYYNTYEIAPYSEGITQLLLPFSDIRKYLKSGI